jgi:hypothetical protein
MKHSGLNLPSVLACLFLSGSAVLPFQPWAESRSSSYSFEISVQSNEPGLVQLYYDVGRGTNEADSVLQPIVAGHPDVLRFTLPCGTYRGLRFDPLDRDARMTFSGARIVNGSGRTFLSFAAGQFKAAYQIASTTVADGGFSVETSPGATDPRMVIELAGPFTIPKPPVWREILEVFGASIAAFLLIGWAWRSDRLQLRRGARSAWGAAQGSPGWALAAAALLGTTIANYPVIFAGKSFVSPNYGVALLYGQSPWLPGFQSGEVGDAHKADVAALLWHHLPLSTIERKAVFHEGELPLWNRYDSAGLPLLGQGQSCFGDPLHLIPILANGASWAWDLKFVLAKWLFACGIGLCSWRLFRHLPSALITSVSAAFMGFFVFRINHPAVFSLCYSPWILYCWIRILDARSSRRLVIWLAALIGACWTEMNSGTAKEAYVLLVMLNFSGLCLLLTSERTAREKLGLFGALTAAGTVFVLVGSPIWLTFFHALKMSYTSYNIPLAFQIEPGMFIGLFDEAFYRPFQFESGVVNPSANFFVLIGLLWAAVRWRSLLGSPEARGLLLSSLPALALVFGVVPPGLIARVPFLGNVLHIDNTFSCALVVVFAVLSVFGWREAWDRLGTVDGRKEAVVVVSLAIVAYAAYLGTAQAVLRSSFAAYTWGRNIRLDAFIHGYGLSLVAGAAVFLAALHSMRRRGAATSATLICALVGFGAIHWRDCFQIGEGFSDYIVRPAKRTELLEESPTINAILARRGTPARVIGFHNDLLPGWSIVYGIEGISGPDALMNPYYREFMDTAGVTRIWDWRYIVEPPEVAKLKTVFDLLNVRFYLGYHMGTTRPGNEVEEIVSSDMDAFESKTAWPRAFFTDGVAIYGDVAQYCSWIKAGDGRPFAGIQDRDWVDLSPVPRVSGDLATRRISAAKNYKLTTNSTSFTVSAPGPGFIVLTEAYEKGNFRATLNGRPVPYIRVNHAFKGIYVDAAGDYDVRFVYWPQGLSLALGLSAFGLGVIAVSLLFAMWGRTGGRNAARAPDPRQCQRHAMASRRRR